MHDFTQKQQSKSNSIAPSYTPSKRKHSDIMAQRADYLQQYDLKDVGKAMQAYYQRKLSPEAKQSHKLDQNIHNPNTQSLVPEIQPSLAESHVQNSPSSVQNNDEELQGKQAELQTKEEESLVPNLPLPPIPDINTILGKKWGCEDVRCNVQPAVPGAKCPDRVYGSSAYIYSSFEEACNAAKEKANDGVPKNCYKRHCNCNTKCGQK